MTGRQVTAQVGAATEAPEAATGSAVPPFARLPVLAIAGVLASLYIATLSRYGYFGDELYFRWAGQHPDWTYADQPPLVPLLAAGMDWLFPGSIVALRLPAVVLTVLGVVVAALSAREFGGATRAQALTAAAYAISPFMVLFGRYLLTSTVDVVLTSTVMLLVVRWLRLRDDRLLLMAGLVTTVELQAKYVIVFVWASVGVAVLAAGPRELLRRRLLWVGAGVAALASVPMLLWQARNGWPQLQMTGQLGNAPATKMVFGGPFQFFVGIMIFCGLVGFVLLVFGLVRILRQRDLRFFGLTFVGLVVAFFALGWSSYYVAGLFPLLWAFGAVEFEKVVRRRWPVRVAWTAFALAAVTVAWNLPLLPLHSVDAASRGTRLDVLATVGWPEMVDQVADVYHSLSPEEQRVTTIVSATYEPASAVARYGPERGIPEAYSPNRGAWYFGAPPDTATTMIYVAETVDDVRPYFDTVTRATTLDNRLGVSTAFQGMPIWICRGQRESWSQVWESLRGLRYAAMPAGPGATARDVGPDRGL